MQIMITVRPIGLLLGALVAAGCTAPASTPLLATGEPLDEARLDRDASGFPSPGVNGYGTSLGQRMQNFALRDCSGQQREFSELFAMREDGLYNKAILFSLGAGWCEPCKEETLELPGIYDELHGEGFDIVQVLFQDENAERPTTGFCDEWTGQYGLPFMVLVDQIWNFYPGYLEDVQAATPVSILVDANANIRYKIEGEAPPNLELEIQQVFGDPYGDGI